MSLEMELTLLSALCKDASTLQTLDLQESDFSTHQSEAIFRQIAKHHKANIQPDIALVWEGLQHDGDSGYFNGLCDVADALSHLCSTKNLKAYARAVKTAAKHTAIERLASHIYEAIGDESANMAERLEKVRAAVADFESQIEVVADSLNGCDLMKETIEDLEKLWQNESHVTGIPTGINELDLQLGGLQDGYLYIVAGRPSMGKTLLGYWLANHAATRSIPAHFVTLEMARKQIGQRALAVNSGVPLNIIKSGMFKTKGDSQNFNEATMLIANLPLRISDTANTLPKLCSLARREKLKNGVKLLVVDQLSAMRINGTNRATGLKEITGELKQLAKELNIPIVLLHQINREATKIGDKRPDIANLKDSGAVEEDADVIIMIHRESYYDPKSNPEECELIIGKNRDGEKNYVVRCGLNPAIGQFTNHVGSWNAPKDEQDDYEL